MIKHYNISNQAYGEFNGGDIIENKPLAFHKTVENLNPIQIYSTGHTLVQKKTVS